MKRSWSNTHLSPLELKKEKMDVIHKILSFDSFDVEGYPKKDYDIYTVLYKWQTEEKFGTRSIYFINIYKLLCFSDLTQIYPLYCIDQKEFVKYCYVESSNARY